MASYNHKTKWSTRTGAVLTGLLLSFVQTVTYRDFDFVCCSHHSSTLHGPSCPRKQCNLVQALHNTAGKNREYTRVGT